MSQTKPEVRPRILVFDDDQTYGSILKMHAKKLDYQITVCNTMSDFSLKALENEFDVAVIDYFLDDSFKGPQVAKVLDSKPAILISQNTNVDLGALNWSSQIKGFLSKQLDPSVIIETAAKVAK